MSSKPPLLKSLTCVPTKYIPTIEYTDEDILALQTRIINIDLEITSCIEKLNILINEKNQLNDVLLYINGVKKDS
jgi:hypothetical protein